MTTLPARQLYTPQQFVSGGDYQTDSSFNGAFNVPSGVSHTVVHNFALPRSTTAAKGTRLNSINVGYSVSTAALASITAVLQTIDYTPAATVNTVASTPASFTTAVGAAYMGVVTVTSPAFDVTANPRMYRLTLTFTGSATPNLISSVAVFYDEALYTNDFTA